MDESQRRADAMNLAFKQACARLELTGATPIIELVAVKIVELANAGESDPDRLTESAVATFKGWMPSPPSPVVRDAAPPSLGGPWCARGLAPLPRA
jgi:hypothetical protein